MAQVLITTMEEDQGLPVSGLVELHYVAYELKNGKSTGKMLRSDGKGFTRSSSKAFVTTRSYYTALAFVRQHGHDVDD